MQSISALKNVLQKMLLFVGGEKWIAYLCA